jgi:hypothetical protein
MEPEGSLLCSQEPAIGLHPELGESNPQFQPISPRTILRSSSHLHLGPSCVFTSDFQTNFVCISHLSQACYILHLSHLP